MIRSAGLLVRVVLSGECRQRAPPLPHCEPQVEHPAQERDVQEGEAQLLRSVLGRPSCDSPVPPAVDGDEGRNAGTRPEHPAEEALAAVVASDRGERTQTRAPHAESRDDEVPNPIGQEHEQHDTDNGASDAEVVRPAPHSLSSPERDDGDDEDSKNGSQNLTDVLGLTAQEHARQEEAIDNDPRPPHRSDRLRVAEEDAPDVGDETDEDERTGQLVQVGEDVQQESQHRNSRGIHGVLQVISGPVVVRATYIHTTYLVQKSKQKTAYIAVFVCGR